MHLNKIKNFFFILQQDMHQDKRNKRYISLQGMQFYNVRSKLEWNWPLLLTLLRILLQD